jgi:hypothetical protein
LFCDDADGFEMRHGLFDNQGSGRAWTAPKTSMGE